MRKTLTLLALAASLSIAACNTVSGVGQDLEAAGRAVTDTANDVRR